MGNPMDAPGPSEEGILPCLQCYSKNVAGVLHTDRGQVIAAIYVVCRDCKAQGPEVNAYMGDKDKLDEALDKARHLWNNSPARQALRECYPYFSRCMGQETRDHYGHLPGFVWRPCPRCYILKGLGLGLKTPCFSGV